MSSLTAPLSFRSPTPAPVREYGNSPARATKPQAPPPSQPSGLGAVPLDAPTLLRTSKPAMPVGKQLEQILEDMKANRSPNIEPHADVCEPAFCSPEPPARPPARPRSPSTRTNYALAATFALNTNGGVLAYRHFLGLGIGKLAGLGIGVPVSYALGKAASSAWLNRNEAGPAVRVVQFALWAAASVVMGMTFALAVPAVAVASVPILVAACAVSAFITSLAYDLGSACATDGAASPGLARLIGLNKSLNKALEPSQQVASFLLMATLIPLPPFALFAAIAMPILAVGTTSRTLQFALEEGVARTGPATGPRARPSARVSALKLSTRALLMAAAGCQLAAIDWALLSARAPKPL